MLRTLFDQGRDHFTGNPLAPVELVAYGDFQCPYSAAAYPVVKTLRQAMGRQLKYVFRHYPQPGLHPLAMDAAVASEAAAGQGMFWEMHDMIFENQHYLSRASLLEFGDILGLDMEVFSDCREFKKLVQKVASDFEGGIRCGVNGTPVFFINGVRYYGFDDFEELYNACRSVLMVAGRTAVL